MFIKNEKVHIEIGQFCSYNGRKYDKRKKVGN